MGEHYWTLQGDRIICGDPEEEYYVQSHGQAVDLVHIHNAGIDTLTAERDELQRRLDSVLAMLAPETLARAMGEQISNKLYRRAKAIAEGRCDD